VRQITALRPGERLPVVVERDGKRIATVIVPTRRSFPDKRGNEQIFGDFGATRLIPPVAGGVTPDSPAEAAGLKEGDRFLSIGGETVQSFEDLQRLVAPSAGKPLPIVVERGTERLTFTVTPRPQEIKGEDGQARTIGLIGVRAPPPTRRVLGIFEAFGAAVEETYSLTITTFTAIGQMISGTRTTKELGGPLRIAEMSGDMAQLGLYAFVWFLGVLSLHLCLINLLPIPMLDGGHLLFYGIEAIRGKPLGERAQEYGFRIGLALVLTLMLFVTWNDLVHLKVVEFIKNLIT
jgi:regulator of sigma E protease